MLNLYRQMLRIRRTDPDLGRGSVQWLPSAAEVLAFARGDGFVCVTNLSPAPIELPAEMSVLLASADLAGGLLPSDATVWLRPDRPQTEDRPFRFPRVGGEC
jgi:alpha-glucosidase